MRRVWAGFLIANVTTDGSDRRMEISTQGDHESDVVEANTESTLQRSCHLRRYRKFLASPLLCLLTELILKIFVHAETLLSSRVPEIPEIDNESAGNEYGPVSLSGAP